MLQEQYSVNWDVYITHETWSNASVQDNYILTGSLLPNNIIECTQSVNNIIADDHSLKFNLLNY